jgi:hypothetical protein
VTTTATALAVAVTTAMALALDLAASYENIDESAAIACGPSPVGLEYELVRHPWYSNTSSDEA